MYYRRYIKPYQPLTTLNPSQETYSPFSTLPLQVGDIMVALVVGEGNLHTIFSGLSLPTHRPTYRQAANGFLRLPKHRSFIRSLG